MRTLLKAVLRDPFSFLDPSKNGSSFASQYSRFRSHASPLMWGLQGGDPPFRKSFTFSRSSNRGELVSNSSSFWPILISFRNGTKICPCSDWIECFQNKTSFMPRFYLPSAASPPHKGFEDNPQPGWQISPDGYQSWPDPLDSFPAIAPTRHGTSLPAMGQHLNNILGHATSAIAF